MNKFKRKDGRAICKYGKQLCNRPFKRKDGILICKHNNQFKNGRILCKYSDSKLSKQTTISYIDYQKLIYGLAHRFKRTTGIEFDRLVAHANLEFVKCQKNYDPKKAKFSTYLHIKIRGLFLEMARKKNSNPMAFVPYYEKASDNTPDEYLFFKEILMGLSADAKEVCKIVFSTPTDLINMLPTKQPRGVNKHQIQKHLRRRGWKFTRIQKVFQEIKKGLL